MLEHSAIGKSSFRRANMTWPGSTHNSNPPLKDNDFSERLAAGFWLEKQQILYRRDEEQTPCLNSEYANVRHLLTKILVHSLTFRKTQNFQE